MKVAMAERVVMGLMGFVGGTAIKCCWYICRMYVTMATRKITNESPQNNNKKTPTVLPGRLTSITPVNRVPKYVNEAPTTRSTNARDTASKPAYGTHVPH